MADPSVLHFGDRAGSYFAVMLFGSVFAVLAFGVWREIRRRGAQRNRTACILAALLFTGPMALIYASSLSGFYEAEVRNDDLVLRYLHPTTIDVRLADIASVRAAPAFKERWRLYITDMSGIEYASATSHRDVVQAAATRLRTNPTQAPSR